MLMCTIRCMGILALGLLYQMRVAYKFIYSEIRQVEQGIKQDLYIFIDFWQRDLSSGIYNN